MKKTFIVAGAGIGGLVCALSLARKGYEVQVLEKADKFEEIGAGIQIAPNASRALDRLGVLEEVTKDAFFPNRLVLMDAVSGDEITAINVDEKFVESFGYRYFVTHRADLHRSILNACQAEERISMAPGAEVAEVSDDGRFVRVITTSGAIYEGDGLIGADGLWSTVRRTVFRDEQAPVDSNYVAYRGTVPMPHPSDQKAISLADDMVIWAGPHLHLVQYPVRRGQLRNQVASLSTAAHSLGNGDLAEDLENAFRSACATVAEGIFVMDTSKRWTLVDRDPLANWAKGRVVLLGDAAHPMLQYLAQGACQAIEDAVVLAESLKKHDGVVEKAFMDYESRRQPRASKVQANARLFGEVLHIDGMGAVMRNKLLSQLATDDFSPLEWLYAEGNERGPSTTPALSFNTPSSAPAIR